MLGISGCSSIETNLKIVDIFHQAETSQVQILYTRTREKVSCPIGAHGCTYNTLEQDLYQVTLPLQEGSIGGAALAEKSHWIRSGTDQVDYTYYKSNPTLVVGNTQSRILTLCIIDPASQSGCASTTQRQNDEDDRSAIVLGDDGRTLLWHHTLYTLPNLGAIPLLDKPGYREFIDNVRDMQASDSSNAAVRLSIFDGRTLVATPAYASADKAPLGYRYSIPDGSVTRIDKHFDSNGAAIGVLSVQQGQDELNYLLNFFDYDEGTFTKTQDEYYLYRVGDNALVPIADTDYQEGRHVWDVVDQVLYEISLSGDNEIRIKEIGNWGK